MGEVASVDLSIDSKVVFSFQIAGRSAQLEESQASPWGGVLLYSLTDLVASKMVALVERGAPRDFRDIYMLCINEITTPTECWQLWQRRQDLTGSDKDIESARLAIETHLARIVQHRPLSEISDDDARLAAKETRSWFKDKFLSAVRG
jgi:predicted nucleotidyltransferase component of viral defense system